MTCLYLVDKSNIKELLNNNKSFILDFYADWCGPCQALSPIFDSLSSESKYNNIVFVKVDVDKFPELATDYSVGSIPTLIFSKDGHAAGKKINGLKTKSELIALIDEYFF